MRGNCFIVFSGGLILSSLFIFLLRKISLKFKIFFSRGIPLIGGIGIGASLIICCGLFTAGSLPKEIFGIIAFSCIILFFGVFDDWREMSILAKFLVQLIAASLLIIFGVKTRIV